MVDQYYRKITSFENDIENAMQISSILLKLKEYDNDLSKIGNNSNNISSNLGKINTNETNISSNLEKINDNETNISTNLEQINDNETNISDNLEKINDIKSLLPTSEIFKKTYSIKNQLFRFTRNIIYFKLLETEIENNFNKDGKLEFDSYIYHKYDNLQKDHHRLQHEYLIYDDKNNLLHKKILNKTNTSDLDFDKNIMLVEDNFYVTFNNNYNKITILLYLFRVYRHGAGNFNLELINENFVNITYLDKNDISLKIEKNKSDISTNSGKIDSNINVIRLINKNSQDNTADISSNLSEISTDTGNISSNLEKINNITKTIILKNIYFTNFDSTDESFTRHLISLNDRYVTPRTYETAVIHSVNMEYYFKKDDVIEIDCKLMFQHSTYDYSNDTFIYYNLYEEVDDKKQILSKESRRYNQFSLVNDHNRVIAYNKLCYKLRYDIDNIIFNVKIGGLNSKMNVDYFHYIVKNGLNCISIKHYGKS